MGAATAASGVNVGGNATAEMRGGGELNTFVYREAAENGRERGEDQLCGVISRRRCSSSQAA